MNKFHLLWIIGFFFLMGCSSPRQAQQVTTNEVRYVPQSSIANISSEEKQKIDELINRKIGLQNEIDRLTQASDSGNQADTGQLEILQKQMILLDAEIAAFLSSSERRAYFEKQWQFHNK
ncbi:MAG: hypothetical protein PWR20_460 [Bacteroidales bacterium]|jgi:TolA-binding protein|nr:hypothetical protein [Bacteroidales bacterium]NLH51499.1 hypothetical protein [Bacteroidales bacterium]NPV35117.1 hypothetical protein [Bacteroidales bacterium]